MAGPGPTPWQRLTEANQLEGQLQFRMIALDEETPEHIEHPWCDCCAALQGPWFLIMRRQHEMRFDAVLQRQAMRTYTDHEILCTACAALAALTARRDGRRGAQPLESTDMHRVALVLTRLLDELGTPLPTPEPRARMSSGSRATPYGRQ